ncbi:clotting factor G beta subunit-like [Brevipalpus obovatus]|uniref:clotting factor G beta subunit-like n=1 Tax=Brevipalpus obovatus TaxID=246614 RepID=UPI003D9F4E5E
MQIIITSLVLLVSILPLAYSECDCGLQPVVTRIYDGKKVQANKYPWMARLLMNDMTSCTGTIIDRQNILTADHCVIDRKKSKGNVKVALNPSQIWVAVGKTRIAPKSILLSGKDSLKVSKITRYHENGIKDIAIVTLEKPLTFSSSVSPICVPKDHNGNFTQVIAAGWGDTGTTKVLPMLDTAWDLRESQMTYIDEPECEREIESKVGARRAVKYYELCAIDRVKGHNICQGDSGGPLMWLNPEDGRWYVIGVAALAFGECSTQLHRFAPSIFTFVGLYANFIRKTATGTCPSKEVV